MKMEKTNAESVWIRFFYGTLPGRLLLKPLVSPWISRLAGRFLDTRISRILIPFFRRKCGISMRDVIVPDGGFPSFNAFFCRKRRGKATDGDASMISPCDGLLTCIPIRKGSLYDVKHTGFTLAELLGDGRLAEEFQGGTALIFRLTPAHYHRYVYAADGEVLSWRRIKGIFHCVRPICTRQIPVYAQNAREYQVIQTKELGKIVQMEVGAMLVGRIVNEPPRSRKAACGEEKGRFEYGGSTIILLLQKGKIPLGSPLWIRGMREGEQEITLGERLI